MARNRANRSTWAGMPWARAPSTTPSTQCFTSSVTSAPAFQAPSLLHMG